ncbi:MAG: isoprenyl transferase [Candidatus Auribacterota bacterium]|nr:isoprenyl transferase [Candidatus Auribacterota bacterium]
MNTQNRQESGNLPRHIAIIMDGNGRWAKERGLSRLEGHRAGAETVRKITTAAAEIGIEYLTLYAFSVENWSRPRREIQGLMRYLKEYLKSELPVMQKNNIRLRAIGRTEEFSSGVRKVLSKTIEATAKNTGLTLVLALNYGGRSEIIDGIREIVKGANKGEITPEMIDEDFFSRYLYAGDIPDPDLLIRTSGEMRVSNFLLWEISYTELWITPICWPDFDKNQLLTAINDYQKRERRYGGLIFAAPINREGPQK